jgi:molybdopterin converting factor small subunit
MMAEVMAQEKSIVIEYFALLREQRGQAAETAQTTAATPAELYAQLQAAHGLTLPCQVLGVALNGSYSHMHAPLRDGDRVAYIQPVAGG